MPGGCWICNPMCGKCQPAPLKSATCPECGTLNVFEREPIIAGFDLAPEVRPKVVKCNYSGYVCAYPCGNSRVPKHEHGDMPCERNTPPSEEWLEQHPKMRMFLKP